MENASKALIMAGEILIGVMILTIGVYLFNLFAGYSAERYKEIEDIQIAQFNDRFYKYYGERTDDLGKEVPIECTIHDIVSLANFAQKHNLDNNLIEESKSGDFEKKDDVTLENSIYVQIDLDNTTNLELKSKETIVSLIKQNDLKSDTSETKYYRCTHCEPKGNNQTVNYVKFVTIK